MVEQSALKDIYCRSNRAAKNSYDADASWVQVRIGNTGNLGKQVMDKANEPFVEIEDDGNGMSFETNPGCVDESCMSKQVQSEK